MKAKSKFKRHGFATISLILFLPLLGLMLFSFGFSGYLIQHKTKIRSICLTEGRKIQENLARNEESILKLNPIVAALRFQLKLAYIELAAAVAAENPVWVAEVQIKITAIKTKQNQLDVLQQSLIRKAKLETFMQTRMTQNRLNQVDQETNLIWRFYLQIFSFATLEHAPEVSLVRDSPDIAPIYELAKDHDLKQRLVFRWQTHFHTKTSAQKLLNSDSNVEFLCSVGAKKEGTKWNLSINVDKS